MRQEEVSFEDLWGGITEDDEAELLRVYRRNVEQVAPEIKGDPLFDDHYLRRFLRARSHDLQKAEAMFMNHLKWRREYGTDTILEDFVYEEREAFLALYPQGYHKVDKLGRPIYIQHLGQINMKALKHVTSVERMVRFHVQEYERSLKYIFPACSRVAGEHVSQTLAILDLKGVGLRHFTGEIKKIVSELTRIDQDNYPETMGKMLIINVPSVFRAMWSIVKPMLDPRTQNKVEVCPGDFLPVLKEWVDVENIPSYLGGTSRGSLIDDVGPWRDDEVFARAAADHSKRSDLREGTEEEPRESEEEDDDFVSVCSTRSSNEDDVAVVDKKIRELRRMLGIRDARRQGGGLYADLSEQLEDVMDRVAEMLELEGNDTAAKRGPRKPNKLSRRFCGCFG
jgi:hypothetical protein